MSIIAAIISLRKGYCNYSRMYSYSWSSLVLAVFCIGRRGERRLRGLLGEPGVPGRDGAQGAGAAGHRVVIISG